MYEVIGAPDAAQWIRNGPIEGEASWGISSKYGPRDPMETPAGTTSSFHGGVDITTRGIRDVKVVTRWPMIITRNEWTDTEGWRFTGELNLPGFYRAYYDGFHLDKQSPLVVGSYVDPDSEVGIVGKTGMATGLHLHWQIRVARNPGGTPWAVDPLSPEIVAALNGALPMPEYECETYVVEPGDTMSGIAAAHNVSDWRLIARASGYPEQWNPATLAAGSTLCIPVPSEPGTGEGVDGDAPPVEPPPSPPEPGDVEETAAAALHRSTAVIKEVAADLSEKAGLLHVAADEAERAALALIEGRD